MAIDVFTGSALELMSGLGSAISGLGVILDAIFIALAVLITVEVARGVMKR